MREVARRAGGREKLQDFYLRCGNEIPGSLPQSAALTAPSSEGAKGEYLKPAPSEGAKGEYLKPASSEGAKGGCLKPASSEGAEGGAR